MEAGTDPTQGFAIGCISSAVPTYLSETGMEIGDRGPANAINAILLISGVPLAYWIDYGFVQYNTDWSWRQVFFKVYNTLQLTISVYPLFCNVFLR